MIPGGIDLERIKLLITEQTGLRISDENIGALSNMVQIRMKALRLSSPADYYQLLLSFNRCQLAMEHEHFSRSLTTGETYFFRDNGQMNLLSQHILPELITRNRSQHRLRIWSAGCASG